MENHSIPNSAVSCLDSPSSPLHHHCRLYKLYLTFSFVKELFILATISFHHPPVPQNFPCRYFFFHNVFHFLGFLHKSRPFIFIYGGCVTGPHAQLGGPGLLIYDFRIYSGPVISQPMGNHFSRPLRHVWAILFFNLVHHKGPREK